MKPLERHELVALFDGCEPPERCFPDVDVVDWGVLDYLGWIHPGGHLGYVVVPREHGPQGLVLRRTPFTPRRRRAQMCSWCHTLHRSGGVAMFSRTVDGSDGRRSIGVQVCRNLDCSLRLRNLTGDVHVLMPETLHVTGKIARLERALDRFVERVCPAL
jgi:hypothetical protein